MNRPQCAKDFEERFIKSWPVIIQAKKDGVRCMTAANNHKGWMKPRKKCELVHHKYHIQNKLAHWFKGVPLPGDLDGELFKDGMWFEDVVSAVKGPESEYHAALEYHLFDIMDDTHMCGERLAMLGYWYNALPDNVKEFVKLVPHQLAYNMRELKELMDKYAVSDEGIIIRDPSERYTFDKRTRGCQRWKYQLDDEYEIVDVVDGVGKNVGVATMVCITPNGNKFNAAATGTREQRMQWFTDRKELIGKQATIVFQNLSKKLIPRFPSCKAIRDYEETS